MCYICEARGNVGANYKAAQKEINAAIRAIGRPSKGSRAYQGSWGNAHDWTVAPPVGKRLWSNADLKAYGKQYQERVTP